jgi:hypothetical protein
MWRAGPDAKPRGRQSGFTLLEILVVVEQEDLERINLQQLI